MDIREMVASITKEILLSMNAEKKPEAPRVLYVFCDSQAHEAFQDHFIHLKNHGICHDILFLDGETSSWLGMHKIECGGAGKILTADEYAPAPLEVLRHVEAMKELGVEFVEQKRLADRVVSKLKSQLQKAEAKPEQPTLTALDEAEAVFSGKLLTADWIKSQPELRDTTVHVKKGAIVSPLAYDSMRERGITVSYLGKG